MLLPSAATSRPKFDPESLAELNQGMITQHEKYLNQDDPIRKQDALYFLTGFIMRYLDNAPNERKFTLKETENVLRNSALNMTEFDPKEGSLAFKHLAKYAENLLEQPWRKDFHKLKLTSGYFVHNISAHLENAHVILSAMGYTKVGATTLELLPNPDYNRLKAVSRDCYIASEECRILHRIRQRVTNEEPDYPLTIAEVFEFRTNHVGDANILCRKLLRNINLQRLYFDKQQQKHESKFQKPQKLSPTSLSQKLSRLQAQTMPADRLIDSDQEVFEELNYPYKQRFVKKRQSYDNNVSVNFRSIQKDTQKPSTSPTPTVPENKTRRFSLSSNFGSSGSGGSFDDMIKSKNVRRSIALATPSSSISFLKSYGYGKQALTKTKIQESDLETID